MTSTAAADDLDVTVALPENLSKPEPVPETLAGTFEEFVAGYAADFHTQLIAQFARLDRPASVDEQGLRGVSGELFDALLQGDGGDPAALQAALGRLAATSAHAEAILHQLSGAIIGDFSRYLAGREFHIAECEKLVARLGAAAHLLDEMHFQKVRGVCPPPPDVDHDSEEYRALLAGFERCMGLEAAHERPHVATFFHSLPVDYDADVVYVGRRNVTLRVHRYQAVALDRFGMAFITHPEGDLRIQAFACGVDVRRRLATFSHLVPVTQQAERRAHVRVEPARRTEVRVRTGEHARGARLVDLSERALTLYLRCADTTPFETGTTVTLCLELPDAGRIECDGTILKEHQPDRDDPMAHRLVVELEDTPAVRQRLSRYVAQRQHEIMEELARRSERA